MPLASAVDGSTDSFRGSNGFASAVSGSKLSARIAIVLSLASGGAGLANQIVWTQQATLWLGHEAAAVLAVVAAFFGGLSLGAFVLAGRIERSPWPARWYAAAEAVVGLWSLLLALALPLATSWLLTAIGDRPTPAWQWLVAFVGTFGLLLPATAAMGATLPALERAVRDRHLEQRTIARLYAANTLGAVAGVLIAAFFAVPVLGLFRTAVLVGTLNLLCGLGALLLRASGSRASGPASRAPPADLMLQSEPTTSDSLLQRRRAVLATLACTGLLGIGYEVLTVRMLSQVTENTVYTFALLLAVYLVGTAFGATCGMTRMARRGRADGVRKTLLMALAGACLIGTVAMADAEGLAGALRRSFGHSVPGALAAESALAVIVFLPPTLVMGALFAHLLAEARSVGVNLGVAVGVNTLGAAIAPLVFGVLLLPTIGPKTALLSIAGGYLALSMGRSSRRRQAALTVSGVGVALALLLPPLRVVELPPGGAVVRYRDGMSASVSVVEDGEGIRRLRIDNRQQEGSSGTVRADARQALLPLLLHPAPHRALFLGLGTGITARAAAQDAELHVDAVELLPEVIEASSSFANALPADPVRDMRLDVLAADARRYVRATSRRYDLIVADNFHPARSGSGALYTVEHFDAVRARLAEGGLFCQWLPLHQLDLQTVRSIVGSFMAVYPNGAAVLATNSLDTPVLGLVGHKRNERFEADAVRGRLARAALSWSPAAFGFEDEVAVLGSFIAGPGALHRFAGDAPMNTDDRPVVAYRAPRITYAPDSRPRDRLLTLLTELALEPEEWLALSADPSFGARLNAYRAARARFLEVGRDVSATSDVREMLRRVGEPLFDVLRISPDFRAAYDPLFRMARALERVDPAQARAVLARLVELQPFRQEGRAALVQVDEERP